VLPRRSAPVVLGLVVTSLVTMLASTQLVTEATRPSFQRTRPIELTLGAPGPVQAGPPAAPEVPSGPPTHAGGPAGSGDAGPPPGPDLTARRLPAPDGAQEGPAGVATVADRHALPRDAPAGAGSVPGEALRTLIGHRGLPCSARARLRSDRLPGRWSRPCATSGAAPAPPTREPKRAPPSVQLPPRRPGTPTPGPEAGPSQPGNPPGRGVPAAVPPTVSGPPRVPVGPRPEARPPSGAGVDPGAPAARSRGPPRPTEPQGRRSSEVTIPR